MKRTTFRLAVVGAALGFSIAVIANMGCSGPKFKGCTCLKARVNVKDGARTDGKTFQNFNTSGSSGRIRVPQAWPNFTLRRRTNDQAVFHHNGYAWGSNGETPSFQNAADCFTRSDIEAIYKDGFKPGRTPGEKIDFLVEGNSGCPGQCRVYVLHFEPADIRFTADEPNCAANIDIVARPLRVRGNQPVCRPCS